MKKTSLYLLAAFFIIGGVLHFVFTERYLQVLPPWLPYHQVLVDVSGFCEIAGGLAVLFTATRRAAGIGLVLLSIAVLPANVQMLLNARAEHAAWLWQALLWLRLPLQGALIYWIVRATGVMSRPKAGFPLQRTR